MGRIENYVEGYLKKACDKNDILCYKFTSPSNNGVPDRVLIGHGHVVFVETKAHGNKPRELQRIIIQRMRDHGADVRVIDTREQVDALIDEMTQHPNERRR